MVSKWFWAIAILVMFANGAIFWVRAKKQIKLNPDLKEGYHKIIKGFLLWGNLPWIVMGIGCTVGGVTSGWRHINLHESSPYVLAFYASIALVWVLGSYWIFFRDGAKALVRHPGLLNYDLKKPVWIKIMWVVCTLGAMFAIISNYI